MEKTTQAQPTSLPQIRGTPKLTSSSFVRDRNMELRRLGELPMRRDAVSIGCDKHKANANAR